MSTISQCRYEISRYERLKSKINLVISYLSSASNNADDIAMELKDKYQVNDDNTPILSEITKLNSDISVTYDYLNTKVIPAIDTAIYSLQKEIERLEYEEYLLRLKMEEEKKKQEQVENTNGNILY